MINIKSEDLLFKITRLCENVKDLLTNLNVFFYLTPHVVNTIFKW